MKPYRDRQGNGTYFTCPVAGTFHVPSANHRETAHGMCLLLSKVSAIDRQGAASIVVPGRSLTVAVRIAQSPLVVSRRRPILPCARIEPS